MKNIFQKLKYFSYRIKATYKFKNICTLKNEVPLISFSFDDFPMTAASTGADILNKYNIKGSFYVSLGLLEKEWKNGKMCDVYSIKKLISKNHEIGSHTYTHANAYEDSIETYEKSIIQNENNFKNLFLTNGFETFSFPFGFVSTDTKRIAQKYFRCARTSYRGINIGRIDLNMLKAYPIFDNGEEMELMKSVIDLTVKKKGWLIFYTHDVREEPSSFGCTPNYFGKVVKCSIDSGAKIVTLKEACDIISAPTKA